MAAATLQKGLRKLAGKIDRKFGDNNANDEGSMRINAADTQTAIKRLNIEIGSFTASESKKADEISAIEKLIAPRISKIKSLQSQMKGPKPSPTLQVLMARDRELVNLIKKKKVLETQKQSYTNSKMQLEMQLQTLENANIAKRTYQAMKSSSVSIKKVTEDLKVEEIDDFADDLLEDMDKVKEVSDSVNGILGQNTDIDSDELMDDLLQDPNIMAMIDNTIDDISSDDIVVQTPNNTTLIDNLPEVLNSSIVVNSSVSNKKITNNAFDNVNNNKIINLNVQPELEMQRMFSQQQQPQAQYKQQQLPSFQNGIGNNGMQQKIYVGTTTNQTSIKPTANLLSALD